MMGRLEMTGSEITGDVSSLQSWQMDRNMQNCYDEAVFDHYNSATEQCFPKLVPYLFCMKM